jgi:hypothetical protein
MTAEEGVTRALIPYYERLRAISDVLRLGDTPSESQRSVKFVMCSNDN